MDLVYQNGLRQDYNASVSGKTARTNYYVSLGYTNNDGIVVGDQFRASRSRVNLDTEITKWLNIGLNAQFVHKGSDDIKADTGAAKAASPLETFMRLMEVSRLDLGMTTVLPTHY